MTFKPFTIVLLLAAVCFHHNALAFPATVNPAPTPEATSGLSNAVLADVSMSAALGTTNAASTDQNDKNKGVSLASTPEPGGKAAKSSKAAALSQVELAEACAPLLSNVSGGKGEKNEKGELTKSELGGGKGNKIEQSKELGSKNTTTTVGKTPTKKSSASVFIRSSVVTSAMPLILSTGVGLLIL